MPEPIVSPCRQICRMGSDGLCDGCGRTLQEIALWGALPKSGRQTVMDRVSGWQPRPPDDR